MDLDTAVMGPPPPPAQTRPTGDTEILMRPPAPPSESGYGSVAVPASAPSESGSGSDSAPKVNPKATVSIPMRLISECLDRTACFATADGCVHKGKLVSYDEVIIISGNHDVL